MWKLRSEFIHRTWQTRSVLSLDSLYYSVLKLYAWHFTELLSAVLSSSDQMSEKLISRSVSLYDVFIASEINNVFTNNVYELFFFFQVSSKYLFTFLNSERFGRMFSGKTLPLHYVCDSFNFTATCTTALVWCIF